MTDATPQGTPRPAHEGLGSALRRGWRALAARSLVARKGGRERFRAPLALAIVLAIVLLEWSWPITFVAVAVALAARVEFAVVLDRPEA